MTQEIEIAIIAALAAISGSLVSQIASVVLSFFDKRHLKKVLLRQKYEEMVLLFVESGVWLQALHNAMSFQDLYASNYPLHMRKVYALSLIYFPELVKDCSVYLNDTISYTGTLSKCFDPLKPIPAIAQATAIPDFKKAQDNFVKSRLNFQQALEKYASKYT